MQLGEGLVEQQAAAGVGPLGEARHGGMQRRARVRVLPHAVLRQQPHVPRPAPPRRCRGGKKPPQHALTQCDLRESLQMRGVALPLLRDVSRRDTVVRDRRIASVGVCCVHSE